MEGGGISGAEAAGVVVVVRETDADLAGDREELLRRGGGGGGGVDRTPATVPPPDGRLGVADRLAGQQRLVAAVDLPEALGHGLERR